MKFKIVGGDSPPNSPDTETLLKLKMELTNDYTNTMSTSRELSNSKLQAIGKLRENHTAFLRFVKERAVVKATDARLKRDSILAASVAARLPPRSHGQLTDSLGL